MILKARRTNKQANTEACVIQYAGYIALSGRLVTVEGYTAHFSFSKFSVFQHKLVFSDTPGNKDNENSS